MSAACIRVKMPCTMHGPEEPGGGSRRERAVGDRVTVTDRLDEDEIAALALEVADPVGTLTSANRTSDPS